MDTLPTELRIQIIETLYEEPPNLGHSPLKPDNFLANLSSVRLASRSLNAAASDVFLKTYFRSRIVLLERKSLSRLYQIATTQHLSRYLQHIVVLTYKFFPSVCETYDTFWNRLRKMDSTKNRPSPVEKIIIHQFTQDDEVKAGYPKAKAAHRTYQECLEDQESFYKDFAHVGLLARIFRKLGTALRSVELEGYNSGAFSSRLMREVPVMMLPKESEIAHSEAMSTVVRAMHRSEGSFCQFQVTGLSLNSVRLPAMQRSRFLQTNVKHLHSLHLMLMIPQGMSMGEGNELYRSLMAGFLSDFLATVPFLDDLSLMFPDRLANVIPFKALLGKRIKKLKKISLAGITTRSQDLAMFLTTHKQLELIRLDDIILRSGTWRGIFKHIRKGGFSRLSTFETHNLGDRHAMIHLLGDDVTNYVLNKTDEVDWKTMELYARKSGPQEHAIEFLAMLTGLAPDALLTLPHGLMAPGADESDEEPGEDVIGPIQGPPMHNVTLNNAVTTQLLTQPFGQGFVDAMAAMIQEHEEEESDGEEQVGEEPNGEESNEDESEDEKSDGDESHESLENYPETDSEPEIEIMHELDDSSGEESDAGLGLTFDDDAEGSCVLSVDDDGYSSEDSATDRAADAIAAAL